MAPTGARAWLDGVLVPAEALNGLTGPGAFETVRVDERRLHLVEEHLGRLARGAGLLHLPWPPPWDPRKALLTLARLEPGPALAMRLEWRPPHLSVVARPNPPPPREACLFLAGPSAPLRPFGVKTLARASYAALRAEALERGAFDALVHLEGGELVEGTVTNLFLARAEFLVTPRLASGALPGVVRSLLLTQLEHEGLLDSGGRRIGLREQRLGLEDLWAAEEVLLTNALVGVLGVRRLLDPGGRAGAEERLLPGARGPVASALAERFAALASARSVPRFQGVPPD